MNKHAMKTPLVSMSPKAKSVSEKSAAANTPKCEKCGGRTYLSRREPHPTLGLMYELHTFRCASCENLQECDADLRAVP